MKTCPPAAIVEFLKESMQMVKTEFAQVGITPRQFSRFGGDEEYASDELLDAMDAAGILWSEWMDYEAIINETLFAKAVRWQAAYNTTA